MEEVNVDAVAYREMKRVLHQEQDYILRLKEKYDRNFEQNKIKNKIIEELEERLDFYVKAANENTMHKRKDPSIQTEREAVAQPQSVLEVKLQFERLEEEFRDFELEESLYVDQIKSAYERRIQELELQLRQREERRERDLEAARRTSEERMQRIKAQYSSLAADFNQFITQHNKLVAFAQKEELCLNDENDRLRAISSQLADYKKISRGWGKISEFLDKYLTFLNQFICKYQIANNVLATTNDVLKQQIDELQLHLDKFNAELLLHEDNNFIQMQLLRQFYVYYDRARQLFSGYKKHINAINEESRLKELDFDRWIKNYEHLANELQDESTETLRLSLAGLKQHVAQAKMLAQQEKRASRAEQRLQEYEVKKAAEHNKLLREIEGMLLEKDREIEERNEEVAREEAMIGEMHERIRELFRQQTELSEKRAGMEEVEEQTDYIEIITVEEKEYFLELERLLEQGERHPPLPVAEEWPEPEEPAFEGLTEPTIGVEHTGDGDKPTCTPEELEGAPSMKEREAVPSPLGENGENSRIVVTERSETCESVEGGAVSEERAAGPATSVEEAVPMGTTEEVHNISHSSNNQPEDARDSQDSLLHEEGPPNTTPKLDHDDNQEKLTITMAPQQDSTDIIFGDMPWEVEGEHVIPPKPKPYAAVQPYPAESHVGTTIHKRPNDSLNFKRNVFSSLSIDTDVNGTSQNVNLQNHIESFVSGYNLDDSELEFLAAGGRKDDR